MASGEDYSDTTLDQDGNSAGKKLLSEEEFQAFKTKIEATTTKDAAKEACIFGVQACEKVNDLATWKRLKEVLVAHNKFMDEAAKGK